MPLMEGVQMIIEAPNEQVKPITKCPDCVPLDGGVKLCQKHSIAAKRELVFMLNWSVTRKSA